MRVPALSEPSTSLALGRLSVLLLSLGCPAVMLVRSKISKRYSNRVPIRTVSTVGLVIVYLGVVVSQLVVFRLITNVRHVTDDNFVFSILVFENIVALALLFYSLRRS
jgi:hypothetical protein